MRDRLQKTLQGPCKIQSLFALPSNLSSSQFNNSSTAETWMGLLVFCGNVTHSGYKVGDFKLSVLQRIKRKNHCTLSAVGTVGAINKSASLLLWLLHNNRFCVVIVQLGYCRSRHFDVLCCTFKRATMTTCLKARLLHTDQIFFCINYVYTLWHVHAKNNVNCSIDCMYWFYCCWAFFNVLSVKEEGKFKHQKALKNFSSSRWESNSRLSEF